MRAGGIAGLTQLPANVVAHDLGTQNLCHFQLPLQAVDLRRGFGRIVVVQPCAHCVGVDRHAQAVCFCPEQFRELLREWYEQTEAEAARYPNFKVAITFYYQIERAFEKVLNLEKFVKWLPGCGVGRIQYRAKA